MSVFCHDNSENQAAKLTITRRNQRLVFLVFKLLCDWAFWNLLQYDTVTYRFTFSIVKYALGMLCCIVIYELMDHTRNKASAFFLKVVFYMQIIPVTTIYALSDENTVCYLLMAFSFLVTVLYVKHIKARFIVLGSKSVARICHVVALVFGLFLVYSYFRDQGLPTMTALDVYEVYEIREDAFFSNKYLNYLMQYTMAVLLPLLIAFSVCKKKYLITMLGIILIAVLYLYTGRKTYLVSAPLAFICAYWGRKESFAKRVFVFATFAFAAIVIGAVLSKEARSLLATPFHFLGRRELFVPANLKFKYYDYFSTHPKLGIYGMGPQWLFPVKSIYSEVSYPNDIARIYFGKPEMYSNTGYLIEGYMRFGHIGFLIQAIVFAWMLQLMDLFQKRTGFDMTIGYFIYPVFSLVDGHLLDKFYFGSWMIILLILIFYKRSFFKASNEKRKKHGISFYLKRKNNIEFLKY